MKRQPNEGGMENTSGELSGTAVGIDWDRVLAEHDRWLRCVVLARTGENQAVDDVMQEIALAAVKQNAPIQNPAKVAPWLYQLAVRQSLLYRRKVGRRRKLVSSYADRGEAAVGDRAEADPLDWLLLGERSSLVRRTLHELPRRDAEILVLKYVEDWSYRQLAEHLGLSISAVEARLHRARKRMRSRLAANPVFEFQG